MSEKVASHDQEQPELSRETKQAVKKAVARLVDTLPKERREGEGLAIYDAHGSFEIPSGGKLIVRSSVADAGLDSGINDGMFVLGENVTYENPDTVDGFEFSANHSPETGELLMSFYEKGKVDARAEELLADPDFIEEAELPSVIMPRYEVTPASEIYQNGVESVTQTTIGEAGIGATFFYDSEEEAAASNARAARYVAAHDKARSEFGSYELTEERAQRLLALIAEVQQ